MVELIKNIKKWLFCLFQAHLFLYTEASSIHSNNFIPNMNEAEMMEIKTEFNNSDELNSDSENANIVDNNSIEFVTGSMIIFSFFQTC